MNSTKVEVKKITIKIDNKEIELTPDQAKELKSILNEMFKDDTPIYIPYPVERPVPYPWPEPYPWKRWEIWCDSGTAGHLTFSSTTNKSE